MYDLKSICAFQRLAAVTLFCLATLLCAAPVAAHNIVYRIVTDKGIGVRFSSSASIADANRPTVETDGIGVQFDYIGSFEDVPAFADYRVYGPGDEDKPFQRGQADRLGRVVFLPDRAGQWRIELQSQEGHEAVTHIDVTRNLAVPPAPQWGRWLLLISLVTNAGLLAYLQQSRRKDPEDLFIQCSGDRLNR